MNLVKKILWREIKSRPHGKDLFRQHCSYNGYILDFYCQKAGLVIEIKAVEQLENFHKKEVDKSLAHFGKLGIEIIYISEQEVLLDCDKAIDFIWQQLEKRLLLLNVEMEGISASSIVKEF